MVKINRAMMKEAGIRLSQTLSEILVCPLSKKPLRYCEKTNSLINDQIRVAFPIVNGIPCLVPNDGKILEDNEESTLTKPSPTKEEN